MPQYAPVLELSSLNGANGFQINGEAASDFSGSSVASAGDVNGDGFADLIVGARLADPNGAESGASYVVFGEASGFASELELSSLNGANGFQINGEAAGDQIGYSVASAGDVNGDGFDDLIIGARYADPNGASYVVFGKASGFGATLELSSLNGANGFQINGEAAGDLSGVSVASAGDVNGDGFADLIVGAFGADPNGGLSGASYVVFGKASGFGATLELSSLNGANGFQINGEAAGDESGVSVASAGDFNGDGFADLIVGAERASPNGAYSGASYVVFGKASGFAATLELSSLDGANGFQISGEAAYDHSGIWVASAGDINGDGFGDLILGAKYADPNGERSGASYVVFGKASGFGATLELSSLNGANGFQINGEAAYDDSGRSVSSAGDFNGDGFDDLIVGAKNASDASYVVFGKASGFGATLELSSLNGNTGFQINGETNHSPTSVSSAGDVNGDGFADLIVGAHSAHPNGLSSGASYVIFGAMPGQAVTRTGTAIANSIHGGNFNDTLSGLGGADTLFGHGGTDTLNGGAGADKLDGGAGADTMRGGGGNDIYVVDNAGDVTTETSAAAGLDRVQSSVTRTLGAFLENLTLTGAGAINGTGNALNNVLIGNNSANTLSGLASADRLIGGAGGDRLIGGLGLDVLTGNSGADKFIFNTAPAAADRDTITDYNVAADTIQLDHLAFPGLGGVGVLTPGRFHVGSAASDSTDRIVYNAATGALYFDADGLGGAAQIQFATLNSGLLLTAADFVVI